MTFEQFERRTINNAERIVEEGALGFKADIQSAWAVDTGASKSAWLISKKSSTVWVVSNNMSYSPILWMGRIGKLGSWQLPNGGDPILNATRKRIMEEMERNLV